MTVTVTPEKFTMVAYDAGTIAAIVQKLLDQIGLSDLDVQIKVDETSPLGRTQVVSEDPVVIETESGAIEDPKRPRQLSEPGAADVLGRALLRVADRRRPEFAGAPADGDLSLPQSVGVGGVLERPARATRLPVAAAALALPLPQPARLHRRRRRGVRQAVGRPLADVGRDRRAVRGRDRPRVRRLTAAPT